MEEEWEKGERSLVGRIKYNVAPRKRQKSRIDIGKQYIKED